MKLIERINKMELDLAELKKLVGVCSTLPEDVEVLYKSSFGFGSEEFKVALAKQHGEVYLFNLETGTEVFSPSDFNGHEDTYEFENKIKWVLWQYLDKLVADGVI